MAAYTATDWTVTVLDKQIIGGRGKAYKHIMAKCVLATGGEVPAGGVPLPKARMGITNYARYILMNDIDEAFTTATARALKWNINATATTITAFALKSATGAAANVGGRAIKKLATSVTLDVTHTLYISAMGF
jgi:hypothetical protein